MSVSHRLAEAVMLNKALNRPIKLSDIPATKGYHPKHIVVQCRRCMGNPSSPTDKAVEKCPQCNGTGVEKLSPKAFNRELLRRQAEAAIKDMQNAAAEIVDGMKVESKP